MTQRKIDTLIHTLTPKEQATFSRLVKFALANNLELFNVKGSLQDRIRTITKLNGACPCYSNTRKCPCNEVIQECKDKGECFCRVFIRRK